MGIRGDRKNYVMSVEFAMRRELEYRQMLEKQGPQQCRLPEISGQTVSEVPRTIPQSTSNLCLRPTQALSPRNPGPLPLTRPSPYPYQGPNLRPSPSSGPSCSAVKRQRGPVPLPEGVFTCKVCQIDCKTGFNLLNHYQGHKHKAKLQGMKGKEIAGVVVGPVPKANERETRPYCDVCGIWCADEFTFRLHFSCANHILRQYDYLIKTRVYP